MKKPRQPAASAFRARQASEPPLPCPASQRRLAPFQLRAAVARIRKLVNSSERLLHRRDNAVYFRPKVFRLELSSSTAEIRDICEQRSVQAAKLGYAGALDLARVLADFEAFDSYAEFEALFGDQVSNVSKSEKRIVLKSGLSISFRSGHPRNLGTSAAPTDWSKVSRLMITAIESPNA